MARISAVNYIKVNDITISSTLLIGDLLEFKPKTQAIAVQRQKSIYFGNEGNFEAYDIFSKPIPLPIIYEDVKINIRNHNPLIQVGNVRVIAISSSSLVQIGTNQRIESEARIKHIRQLTQP